MYKFIQVRLMLSIKAHVIDQFDLTATTFGLTELLLVTVNNFLPEGTTSIIPPHPPPATHQLHQLHLFFSFGSPLCNWFVACCCFHSCYCRFASYFKNDDSQNKQ